MKLTVSYDPRRDAENYVRAIKERAYPTYGRTDLTEKLLRGIESEEIKGVLTGSASRDEALETITNALKRRNEETNYGLDARAEELEAAWKRNGVQIEWHLSFLYQRPFPFEAVNADLTTITLCPYDFIGKRIYVSAKAAIRIQLAILAHELNHFMFYEYYPHLREELGKDKYELLKESLTIFTNPELAGNPDEKPLRDLFLSKSYTSLSEAIEDGTKLLRR